MNKKNGIIKYFIGAIIIVALFVFFVGSFGKQDEGIEGQTGGGSSYVGGEDSVEGMAGDMPSGETDGGYDSMGGGAAPALADGSSGEAPSGADGGEVINAGPSIGGESSLSGLGGKDGDTIGGVGADTSGSGSFGAGDPGKDAITDTNTSSVPSGNPTGSTGSDAQVGGTQGKSGIPSIGGSKSKKTSSKKQKAEVVAETPKDDDSGEDAATLPENGVYTSKQDVAMYLHTYHRLPQNFITKKQANQLGWTGGSLEKFAPGKSIGGDFFGNYEGRLPDGHEYHECDIDTFKAEKRGEKRIVYSEDFHIYYTEDHYNTFELLYEP